MTHVHVHAQHGIRHVSTASMPNVRVTSCFRFTGRGESARCNHALRPSHHAKMHCVRTRVCAYVCVYVLVCVYSVRVRVRSLCRGCAFQLNPTFHAGAYRRAVGVALPMEVHHRLLSAAPNSPQGQALPVEVHHRLLSAAPNQ